MATTALANIPQSSRRAWAGLAGRGCAALLVCCAVVVADAAVRTCAADSTQVSISKSGVTVRAVEARVEDVVAAIGREAGFEVHEGKDLGRRVTVAFTEPSVDAAVRRLLGTANVVMVFDAGASVPLREVSIYGPRGEAPVTSSRVPASVERPTPASRPASAPMLDELREELERAEDVEARRFLVLRLARIRGEGVVQALSDVMADPAPEVRLEAVRALSARDGEQVLVTLGQTVFSDRDPRVRVAAVAGLEAHGGEPARSLLEAATRDRDAAVRAAAEAAIARMP